MRKYRLTALETRRSKGDLIEAYKIFTGKEALQWERFFELAPNKAGTQDLVQGERNIRAEILQCKSFGLAGWFGL